MKNNELKEFFNKANIPTKNLGFYDDPNFLIEEAKNPSFIVNYASFVANQKYSEQYLKIAEEKITKITKITKILFDELKLNGRQGACCDITGILSRILEKEGIWNVCIKGSLTTKYPISTIEDSHFWSIDYGKFDAGHSWLFAPPFTIIDLTVQLQDYSSNEKDFLPEIILSKDAKISNHEFTDVINPQILQQISMHGISPIQYLNENAKDMNEVMSNIPTRMVHLKNDCSLKYTPVAIFASAGGLEKINNMIFSGLSPYELYIEKIKKHL